MLDINSEFLAVITNKLLISDISDSVSLFTFVINISSGRVTSAYDLLLISGFNCGALKELFLKFPEIILICELKFSKADLCLSLGKNFYSICFLTIQPL